MLYPAVITFALVVGVIFGAYWLFVAREEAAEQTALRRRMKGARGKSTSPDAVSLIITDRPLSGIPALDKALHSIGFVTRPAGELISRAGVSMNVGTLLLVSGVAGIAVYLLVWYLSGTVVLALPVGALG